MTKNKTEQHFADAREPFRNRQGETLFIDARNMGSMVSRIHKELTVDDVAEIARTYHAWRGEKKDGRYEDVPGFCKAATVDEIKGNDYVLTPGRYVGSEQEEDSAELFELRMKEMTQRLYSQMDEAEKLDERIKENLVGLGYGE